MKQKKRKGFEEAEPFVKIPHGWIESAAWRSLSARAVCVCVYLLHGWRPGGTYILPARQFKWRMAFATRCKALAELVRAGFFDLVDPGGRYPRRPAVFKPSNRWKARSAALIEDEKAGRAQGKLGWIPTRPRKPSPPRLIKKAKPRVTKQSVTAAAVTELKALNRHLTGSKTLKAS